MLWVNFCVDTSSIFGTNPFFCNWFIFFKPVCYENYSNKSCSCPLFPNFLHPLPQTIVVFLSMLAMCLLICPLPPLQAIF